MPLVKPGEIAGAAPAGQAIALIGTFQLNRLGHLVSPPAGRYDGVLTASHP